MPPDTIFHLGNSAFLRIPNAARQVEVTQSDLKLMVPQIKRIETKQITDSEIQLQLHVRLMEGPLAVVVILCRSLVKTFILGKFRKAQELARNLFTVKAASCGIQKASFLCS